MQMHLGQNEPRLALRGQDSHTSANQATRLLQQPRAYFHEWTRDTPCTQGNTNPWNPPHEILFFSFALELRIKFKLTLGILPRSVVVLSHTRMRTRRDRTLIKLVLKPKRQKTFFLLRSIASDRAASKTEGLGKITFCKFQVRFILDQSRVTDLLHTGRVVGCCINWQVLHQARNALQHLASLTLSVPYIATLSLMPCSPLSC